VRDDGRRATNESAAAPAYLAFARTPSFLTWTSFPQNSFARRAACTRRGALSEYRSKTPGGIPAVLN
jgi:hypothetical protein